MNSIKILRDRFGISQEYLANYLSVTRSLLSMAEIGIRELPAAATIKLASFEFFSATIKEAAGKKKEATTPLPEDAVKILLNHAADHDFQAEKSRRQLVAMQGRYEQAFNSLGLVEHLRPGLAKDEAGKKDHLVLSIIEIEAKKNLQQYGPAAQAVLQWKIDSYVYGAKKARELAGGNNKKTQKEKSS